MGLVSKYKFGDVWYLRYARELGLPRRSLRTRDRAAAETIRLNEEHRLVFNRSGIQCQLPTRMTFSALVTKFLDYKMGQGKARATVEAYRYALNAFGAFLVKDELLQNISLEQIERFSAERRTVPIPSKAKPREPKPGESKSKAAAPPPPRYRREKTIRNELITLITIFRWAKRHAFMMANPAELLELPKKVKYPPRYLRDDEYLRLMAKVNDEEFKDVIGFYLLTGIRRGEGTRILKTKHIDMERHIIWLPQPKSRDFKAFPMSDQLELVLKRLILLSKGRDRLIRFREDNLTDRFHRYASAAGLASDITFHCLRHTFATNLGRLGASFKTIQELMGHSDAASTQIYVHTYKEDLRKAVDGLRLPSN